MYLWFKVFHLIGIICWFAGLFYLPRLFVYHAEPNIDAVSDARFITMERKLFWYIMTPSMVITLFFGLGLVHYIGLAGWLHMKLMLVMLLVFYHVGCWAHLKAFAAHENNKTHRYFRIFNEVPSILLILIVMLAVLKPF